MPKVSDQVNVSTEHHGVPRVKTLRATAETADGVSGILPCPFCGQPPDQTPIGAGPGLMLNCRTEGCIGPYTSDYDRDGVIRQWNTRASDASKEVDAVQLLRELRSLLFVSSPTDQVKTLIARINAVEDALAKVNAPERNTEN